VRACSLVGGFVLLASLAHAQYRDGHESPQATWRLAEADCGVRVLAQERTYRVSHSGNGSEFIRLSAGSGTYVHLTQPIGNAPLIAEFAPSVWIKADKPSLQLLVRVVLPRTLDPGTGKPLMSLLPGDVYTEVGTWQALAVKQPLRLLDREVIALRTRFGKEVDPRGAYVDLIVLNAYSSEGNVDLWLDDLEIQGCLITDKDAHAAYRTAEDAGQMPRATSGDEATVALQGSLLLVKGRPYMPRVIEHNGEPFEWLQTLGFNAIKLAHSPSLAELKEAERLDMWLVAPPPYESPESAGANFGRVLAWSLGRHLADRDLGPTRELALEIRRFDSNAQRPLVCQADSNLLDYSRATGILLLDKPTLGTSLEVASYRSWLFSRPKLARAGTPFWATIATQTTQRLYEQQVLFGSTDKNPDDLDLEQLRLLAFDTLASGVRGLVFQSHLPLAIDSIPGALRTDTLKLLNRELELLEPWVSAGTLSDDVQTAEPGTQISVWQTERSRLLLVTRHAAAQQYVAGPPPKGTISVVIPGVPISDRAYQITPNGLRQLRATPGNGGVRVVIEEPGLATAVVITQDPLVVHYINRTLAASRTEVARLRYDIAARRFVQVQDIDRQLIVRSRPLPQSATLLAEAQTALEQSRRQFEAGDYTNMHADVAKAELALARLRRGHWEQVASAFTSPAASPCIAQFNTLPLHWSFAEKMGRSQWGPNSLPAGDMEYLEQLLQTGWRQDRHLPAGIGADVSLSLQGPHNGRSALRLKAWVAQPKEAPPVIERPIVWIHSAPIPVRQGQLVRIHGWANVPAQLGGSIDGLFIFDSIAGPGLGERVQTTQGWREFTLYRAVPKTDDLTLTFALTGTGEALLDDISISLIDPDPIQEASRR
jgi:hypothetical protein